MGRIGGGGWVGGECAPQLLSQLMRQKPGRIVVLPVFLSIYIGRSRFSLCEERNHVVYTLQSCFSQLEPLIYPKGGVVTCMCRKQVEAGGSLLHWFSLKMKNKSSCNSMLESSENVWMISICE